MNYSAILGKILPHVTAVGPPIGLLPHPIPHLPTAAYQPISYQYPPPTRTSTPQLHPKRYVYTVNPRYTATATAVGPLLASSKEYLHPSTHQITACPSVSRSPGVDACPFGRLLSCCAASRFGQSARARSSRKSLPKSKNNSSYDRRSTRVLPPLLLLLLLLLSKRCRRRHVAQRTRWEKDDRAGIHFLHHPRQHGSCDYTLAKM